MRQVVINLIGNAVTRAPPGTPIRIDVGTAGDLAILEVADEGSGLTPAERDHVFARFYRTDDSRARTTGGFRPRPRHRPRSRHRPQRPRRPCHRTQAGLHLPHRTATQCVSARGGRQRAGRSRCHSL
ncbi:ATP-binding protein [Streptomyces sp. NPDC058740]|uniref:ATP-binding protein n=1 Tax=Streptomyces sp. NPDC058740 TaxID=3346619 RepID=UPI0036880B33